MGIMRPSVNLNGTSRKELIEQRLDAANAVRLAMEAVQKMCPHGRDYIGDPVNFDHDRGVHWRRLEKLKEIYEDLHEEAEQIQGREA